MRKSMYLQSGPSRFKQGMSMTLIRNNLPKEKQTGNKLISLRKKKYLLKLQQMLLVTVVVWLRMAAMGPGLIMQSSAGGNVGGLRATVLCGKVPPSPVCSLNSLCAHSCYQASFVLPSQTQASETQLNAFFSKLPRSWCFCYINKKVTNTLTLF